jgi:hypothetical protein
MKSKWVAVALLAVSFPAHSEVLRYRIGQSTVRPYLFVDDSGWETMPRTTALPSQTPRLGTTVPTDPRDYFLKDAVRANANGELNDVYRRTVEEILTKQFLPAFSQLLRSDFGTTQSPMGVLQSALIVATDQLRAAVPQIEAALAAPNTSRDIVWMIAPWDKAPSANAGVAAVAAKRERFSPGHLGFGDARTPTRNWAAKHWIYDEDGSPISTGAMGNLGNRINEVAQRSSAMITDGEYAETPYSVPPYVYPVAILIHLKVVSGATTLKTQLLMGLQPMVQALNPPPPASGGAEIKMAGVPQAGGLNAGDSTTNYPLTLITFRHNLRDQLPAVRLHFDFGIWEGYSPFRREMRLHHTKETGSWRFSPYLSGDFVKGNTASDWTHLRVPVRVHMTEFDIVANPRAETAVMENLQTGIEIFDRRGGRLIPFPTGIRVGILNNGVTQGAAREIQNSVNQQIAAAFADARTKTRAQALEKFPLAALFINGQPAAGTR